MSKKRKREREKEKERDKRKEKRGRKEVREKKRKEKNKEKKEEGKGGGHLSCSWSLLCYCRFVLCLDHVSICTKQVWQLLGVQFSREAARTEDLIIQFLRLLVSTKAI